MRNRSFLLVVVIAGLGIAAGLAGLAIRSSQEPEEFGNFDNARTVHVAPDGRLVITDLGTGENDGRVVAVRSGEPQEVLMAGLPSTRKSGSPRSELAGPRGAAMAADGTVCAVIGAGPKPDYATLRCTDGLVVDLPAFEITNNPDGGAIKSDPYDVAWDGLSGWVVSDAAANTVLSVSRSGEVAVLGVFWPSETGHADGAATGLDFITVADGRFRYVAFGLFGGGFGIFDLGRSGPLPTAPVGNPVVAIAQNRFANSSNELSLCWIEWQNEETGGDLICSGELIQQFDHPTGLAQVTQSEYVVIENGRPVRVQVPVSPTAQPLR